MRRRSPIRFINGRVYCWAKATKKDLKGFYTHEPSRTNPAYVLMPPETAIKLKRTILCYPRATGWTEMGMVRTYITE